LIFAVLTPCVIALLFAIAAPQAVLGVAGQGFLGPFEWVKFYYAFLVIALGGLAVLVWQYSRRRTAAARALIIVMTVVGIVGMLSIPWPAGFAIQALVSRHQVDSSSLRVVFDAGDGPRALMEHDGRVRIIIPLDITGVPKRTAAKVEGFVVALEAADGTVWNSEQILPIGTVLDGQEFALETRVSRPFYLKVKDGTFKARGSLYLTLFGDLRTSTIPLGDRPATVPRVGACSASRGPNGPPYFLVCSSAFRFPPAEVSYRFLQGAQSGFHTVSASTQPRFISYGPFPAEPGIDPISQDVTFSVVDTPVSEVGISTVEPVAYLRRSFDAREVKFAGQ
jgi:hypothetical protein